MAKPDQTFFRSLLAAKGTTVKQDLTNTPPTDVYYLHCTGQQALDKPWELQLHLPSGTFIVVAQAALSNWDSSHHHFGAYLTYYEESYEVLEGYGGKIGPNYDIAHVMMNCAMKSDSKKPVKFQLGSDAVDPAVSVFAANIRLTAVRVSSLTTFWKTTSGTDVVTA